MMRRHEGDRRKPRAPRAKQKAVTVTKKAETSYWQQLKAYLDEHDMEERIPDAPGIEEALVLIKYAGPQARHLGSLVVALRLLVNDIAKSGREYQFFDEELVEVCDLLHSHIENFGLIPDGGRWYVYDLARPGANSNEDELAALFPRHPHAPARPAEQGGAA